MTDDDQLHRWLVAYWCWYHCGAASWLSEQEGAEFWRHMITAAMNKVTSPVGGRWPRGQERRHARGEQGIKMVTALRTRYGARPQDMVEELRGLAEGGVSFEVLARAIKKHTLFGPWIAFKVCDMLERVCGCPVNFEHADVFMFKDPTRAAIRVWQDKGKVPEWYKPKNRQIEAKIIRAVVAYLKDQFKDLQAPPLNDRMVDLQEVETVLCKWKSHMNGHYPLNNDIDEIGAGLKEWEAVSNTAKEFLFTMPAAVREIV